MHVRRNMSFSSSFLPLRPTRMTMKIVDIYIAHTAPRTTKFYSRGNPSGLSYRVPVSHNDGTLALELQVTSRRSNGLTLATRRISPPFIRAILAPNPAYPTIQANCTLWRHFLLSCTACLLPPFRTKPRPTPENPAFRSSNLPTTPATPPIHRNHASFGP